jgi:hypothetical protein
MSRLETIISKRNTVSAPLGANSTFTGETEELSSFQELTVNIAGAPNTNAPAMLYLQFSPNGTNWDVTIPLVLTAPEIAPLTLRVILPFFRVRYVNDSTALTQLRITTLLHRTAAKQLTRFLHQEIEPNEPIENLRAVITGEKANGTFKHISVSDSGEVKITSTSLPLPSGAATETTLATLLTDTTFTARVNTLGQKTMANSTPVVLASDQNAISVSAASLPLPSGAATETTLATRLAESTFTTRINTLGQKIMTGSTPVVIASDQTALPIDGYVVADIGDTNGLALDTTVNTLLKESTFTGRINTLGQKTMSQSTPVVLASNQSAIPVTVVEGGSSGVQKTLYDIGDTDIYIGSAAQGTASSAAAWIIKKITLDLNGNPVSTLYSSDTAIWDNRTTESYS